MAIFLFRGTSMGSVCPVWCLVVAAVLAVAPDAVLVVQHLLNRGAHMVTAPARQ